MCPHAHTYTHMRSLHVHVCTHTQTHTYTYEKLADARVHTHTNMNTHEKFAHACMPPHKSTHAHTHAHTQSTWKCVHAPKILRSKGTTNIKYTFVMLIEKSREKYDSSYLMLQFQQIIFLLIHSSTLTHYRNGRCFVIWLHRICELWSSKVL